jgi:hypothetical protein
MKTITLIGLLFSFSKGDDGYYNILVIDGGGIRGLIPAMMLSEIEDIAYDYKQNYKNMPTYKNDEMKEVVHIRD